MGKIFQKLETEIQGLSSKEKAALAHYLIEELDGEEDKDVEEIWRKEAESRYQAFIEGNLEAIPGKQVMLKARERLK